jgi:hypothetical protein
VPKGNPGIEAGYELRYDIGLANRFLPSEASLQKCWQRVILNKTGTAKGVSVKGASPWND